MAVPINPDLTPSNKRPGVYVYNLLNSAGGSDENEANTLLLVGELDPNGGGTAPPDTVFALNSEQDAISLFGAKSTVRRQYRAAVSQVGEGNVRIKAVGVTPPSAGVASIYPLTVSVPATNPTAPGSIRVQIAGDECAIGFVPSDTVATINAALYAAIQTLTMAPCSFSNSSPTITVTYNIKGEVGEDLPIRVYVTDGCGVYLGPGSATWATSATGGGSTRLIMGSQTVTAAIGNGDAVAAIAANMKTALAAGDYFVTGGVVATGTLPLYYRSGHDIRRLSACVVTSTGTTVTLSGGSATDGTGSALSLSYAGTLGSGLPTLTTALSNISTAGSFGEWTCPWVSAGSSSTGLTAIATQIETESNGELQKNQHLTIGHIGTETVAAAVAASTTPALTSSLRYIVGHCPDAGQQGYEIAARRAAMLAAANSPATNWDGAAFKTSNPVPLNLPYQAVRATNGTIKAAILDGLEVWDVQSGSLVVERGRNTSNNTDDILWDPSYIRQFGIYRRELRLEGSEIFANTFVKADGLINQSNQVSTGAIESWAIGKMFEWEARGLYDGAEQLKSGVKAVINADDHTRVDLVIPASPVIPLHQLGIVAARSAPAL